MNPEHPKPPPSFWRSRVGVALIGFAAIAGFFLFSEHQAHVLGALPFVLLALCPLLHVFHGHGGHGAESRQRHNDPENKS